MSIGSSYKAIRDYVVANVRHPGDSPYDRIGMPDFTTSEVYYEHGISMLHGFLSEYYVDTPGCLVKVPGQLEPVGVLLEPASVAEKGIAQAFEIQRRLHMAEVRWPGWLSRLLTHRVHGLERHEEVLRLLNEEKEAIKIVVEVTHMS